MNIIDLCEKGWIPDPIIRMGARHISRKRLSEDGGYSDTELQNVLDARIAQWQQGPIAVDTGAANEQHYEVPAEFFLKTLGPHLKYSCCLWQDDVNSLAEAELRMLQLYARRAQLDNGQDVLDLGCGWGSFSLWAAEQYPGSRFTAMSNSTPQRQFIEAIAQQRGLSNLQVITADINEFQPEQRYDRIVSVEMLEHVRNHARLFARIAQWLKPEAYFFAHVFCHQTLTYAYEDRGEDDWMSRHFFTGGMMPSYDLFTRYDQDLQLAQRWWIDGQHYEKTSNAWLQNTDEQRQNIIEILGGGSLGQLRLQRWRMFFIAVAEFFGIDQGSQWGLGHYLFQRRDQAG